MSAIEKFKNGEPAVTIHGATKNVPQVRLMCLITHLPYSIVNRRR